jgi:hypothetical protein
MRSFGRIAIWIAFLMLVLAGTSWAGMLLVAPRYFLVPAAVILVAVLLRSMVPDHATRPRVRYPRRS